MKNNITRLFFMPALIICLIVPTTCKKLEKSMKVTTGEVKNILTTSAEVSGAVVDLGEGATNHGHYYSTSQNVTASSLKTQLGKPAGTTGFTSQLGSLIPGTKYYICAYISDGTITEYGSVRDFTTNAITVPALTTTAISSITTGTAISGGNVTSNGGAEVSARGVCWNTSANPTIVNSKTTNGPGNGSFVSNLTGLTDGTIYYVRAWATNSVGTSYGNELTFTTIVATLPTLSTEPITAITSYSARSGGTISNDGGASITERGVCWKTSTNPLTSNIKTTEGPGTGYFESQLSSLTPATTYYVRAYATNIKGTAYGNELTFTTIISAPPEVTTTPSSSVTNTTAVLNGTVNANNSLTTVTFEYGLTTAYGMTSTAVQSPVNGVILTNVSASITGLASGQLYHYRIVAVSTIGTSYGSDGTFTTTVRDNDGNDYSTIKIGTQVWMKENLKTTKYNDGTSIPLVTDNTAWINLTTPAFCWYENDDLAYKATYGAMYNWYTIGTAKVCPKGWHVPSNTEGSILSTYLGGDGIAGGKMKESGLTHWFSPNTGATNESGFTALPGGFRSSFDGTFWDIGYQGDLWSSTVYSATDAYFNVLYNDDDWIYVYWDSKNYGISVRCIRD